jgi:hypothetical protein
MMILFFNYDFINRAIGAIITAAALWYRWWVYYILLSGFR